jgi:IS5 family transposase
MITKQNTTDQLGLFHGLAEQLDQKHPLYLLANKINWSLFEERFAPLYSEKMGAPAKPIRLMVSLLMLKYLRNLSDENLVGSGLKTIITNTLAGSSFSVQANLVCRQN